MENIIKILLNTLIGYSALVIVMKIMGKREIGQLSLFDLVILLTIADIVVISIENYDANILYSLIPIAFLGILQKVIAFLSLKIPLVRHLFDGTEVLVIANGQLQVENMSKQSYNMDDLLMLLRDKGVRNLNEVEFAVVETNGKISVFRYNDHCQDFPLPLITSGKVNKEHLKFYGKDLEWLDKQLKRLNRQYVQILLAYLNNDRLVVIDQKQKKV